MAKWIKPGIYTQEIDLSGIIFCDFLDECLNSLIPKLFYNIQYDKLSEKFYVLVPKVTVSEVGKRIKKEVEDLVCIGISGEIKIEIKSNENYD